MSIKINAYNITHSTEAMTVNVIFIDENTIKYTADMKRHSQHPDFMRKPESDYILL